MGTATPAAILLGLSFVGFLDALYFVLVTYRWMRPDPRWLPPICRMGEDACVAIVDTRYARVLGLPNAVYGLAWYSLVAAWAVAALAGRGWVACPLVLTAAAAVVLLSLFLAWALVARLRVACVLCFLAHAINVGILGTAAWACASP